MAFKRMWWGGERLVQVGWIVPPVSAYELMEWAAFEQVLGPILIHERVDVSGAMPSAIIANVNRRKGAAAFTIDAFLPKWDGRQRKEQSVEEMVDLFRSAIGKGTRAKPASNPRRRGND